MGPPRPTFERPDSERSWMDYFQDGVHSFTPSAKKSYAGRILPGFDWANNPDPAAPAFKQSIIPYRDASQLDENNQAAFNSFFIRVQAYAFFGNASAKFLSPLTRKQMVGNYGTEDFWDPVLDVRQVASQSTDPNIKNLTKRPKDSREGPVIPYPGWKCFFNFYGHDTSSTQEVKNAVLITPNKGGEDLCEKLSEWRPGIEKVLDPNWPDYLFGDITDPQTGLWITASQIPGTPQNFGGFTLVPSSHKSAQGAVQKPVGPDVINARYNIWTEEALMIYSYQDLVNFMVEDGAIPYELIEQACSGKCTVPPKPTSYASASMPTATSPAQTPPAAPTPAAPPAPAPAQAAPPAAPPAAPEPPEVKYWVTDLDTGSVLPDMYAASAVTSFLESGRNLSLMTEDQSSGWKTPAELGLGGTNPPAGPPPPAQDTNVPAPATTAASTPADVLSQGTAPTDTDNAPLSDEERARLNELNGIGTEAMTPDQVVEWAQLGSRDSVKA